MVFSGDGGWHHAIKHVVPHEHVNPAGSGEREKDDAEHDLPLGGGSIHLGEGLTETEIKNQTKKIQ